MREPFPIWISLHTRFVLNAFIGTLARSHRWNSLYIISPWISSFNYDAEMTFEQMLKRIIDYDTTVYIVTRPPVEEYHIRAIKMLEETKKANIKLAENLHAKLYCAKTAQSDFSLLGSANLTQQSLYSRELGVFITAVGDGRPLVRKLTYEAAEIYRTSKGPPYCMRQFARR